MDPLTGNVCGLSRVEAYAVTSTAGRYTALFKAVLCGWGEIVDRVYHSMMCVGGNTFQTAQKR
jgi:hypothetical protein